VAVPVPPYCTLSIAQCQMEGPPHLAGKENHPKLANLIRKMHSLIHIRY
jgi:hypothetical protein